VGCRHAGGAGGARRTHLQHIVGPAGRHRCRRRRLLHSCQRAALALAATRRLLGCQRDAVAEILPLPLLGRQNPTTRPAPLTPHCRPPAARPPPGQLRPPELPPAPPPGSYLPPGGLRQLPSVLCQLPAVSSQRCEVAPDEQLTAIAAPLARRPAGSCRPAACQDQHAGGPAQSCAGAEASKEVARGGQHARLVPPCSKSMLQLGPRARDQPAALTRHSSAANAQAASQGTQ
jgi:hypothetical protein